MSNEATDGSSRAQSLSSERNSVSTLSVSSSVSGNFSVTDSRTRSLPPSDSGLMSDTSGVYGPGRAGSSMPTPAPLRSLPLPTPALPPLARTTPACAAFGTRRSRILAGILVALIVSVTGCSIVWGVAQGYKPRVSFKDLEVDYIRAGDGVDDDGRITHLISLTGSVEYIVYNPINIFGMHVRSSISLLSSEIAIATTQILIPPRSVIALLQMLTKPRSEKESKYTLLGV